MKIHLGGRILSICASVALFAGCNGSQSAVSGAVPQAESQRLAHRTPSSGDLLYVMTDVNVFYAVNYSTGKVQTVVYEPSGWGAGDCSDTTGNVYILAAATSSQAGQIFKFAHGGTSPVATLTDKNYYPTGCSHRSDYR